MMDVQEIKLSKIKLGRNSRLNISEEDLTGLMQAIKAQGLLQPVGVIDNGSKGYELAYGNRRFLACSKLGWKDIPAIIIPPNGAYSRDLKNLTENVQRRSISLIETGRFIELLKEQGLTQDEIAIRIGVSASFVQSCILAYEDVPKEYRGDIEMTQGNSRVGPGKISITAARTIMNAKKTFRLSNAETKCLFKAAKSDPRFTEASVSKYAAAIKRGHKEDFISHVKPTVALRLQFLIEGKEAERLKQKYVVDGPYRSITQVLIAILKGEKSERVKIL